MGLMMVRALTVSAPPRGGLEQWEERPALVVVGEGRVRVLLGRHGGQLGRVQGRGQELQ